jgi:PKD repeat protein
MEPGVGVPVTVENGNAWAADIVTIWVDWNLDKEFGSNANETFDLTNVGGTGQTFTGTITPPADQNPGQFRMRVRMTYSTAPVPCGNASYGEVEDYTVIVQGTLTANFTADVTQGCEELTVNYTDNSYGDIISWEWEFEGGDPSTSTEQNPTVFYAIPGDYDVTLIVDDGTTTNTSFQTDYISVFELPEVTFAETMDMCLNWPGYELIEGAPAGGEYSGPGVEDGWFYPEVAGAGTHMLTYTYMDNNGCENFADQTCYVDECVGINGADIEASTNIYPNPSTGSFTLEIYANEQVNLKLINIIGEVVYKINNVEVNGFYSKVIELNGLTEGVYYLRLEGTTMNTTEKIVISR